MTEPILLSVEDGLARLTLNRPERLNAFDASMAAAWTRVVRDVVRRDDIGAVLLTGAGTSFCAGGDVAAMATTMSDGGEIAQLATTINRGITALTASDKPVVAAIHGATAGGGLGIMLATDYVVAGRSSRVGSRYANVGLTPDLSVTAHLARAVGERRALQLVLSDLMLTADEALRWGLVAEVVDDDDVVTRAEQVAAVWLNGATKAYGRAKQLIRQSPFNSFDVQLEQEARVIGESFDTSEAKRRIAAFAEASSRKRGGKP